MAHGRIVADGPPNEIKAMVGAKTIRATLPGADLDELAEAARRDCGRRTRRVRRARVLRLRRGDPRPARAVPEARDIEISSAGLEEAFLQLTGDEADA